LKNNIFVLKYFASIIFYIIELFYGIMFLIIIIIAHLQIVYLVLLEALNFRSVLNNNLLGYGGSFPFQM